MDGLMDGVTRVGGGGFQWSTLPGNVPLGACDAGDDGAPGASAAAPGPGAARDPRRQPCGGGRRARCGERHEEAAAAGGGAAGCEILACGRCRPEIARVRLGIGHAESVPTVREHVIAGGWDFGSP